MDGSTAVAFTTANVVETAILGNYIVTNGVSIPDNFHGRIIFGVSGTDYAETGISPPETEPWSMVTDSIQASPAPTVTSFAGSSALSAIDDFYRGALVAFAKGANKGVGARRCTGYVGSTKVFTFIVAWPAVPVSTDEFFIIGRIDD